MAAEGPRDPQSRTSGSAQTPPRAKPSPVPDTPAAAPPPAHSGRAIARDDLREVIRRAAELSLTDADTDETLTEPEVMRIAAELGLPMRHVRQALFELPELTVAPRWYDRYFDPAVFSVTRVVPSRKEPVLQRIEDYLVTREYLQIARRRGDTVAFIPADDTISSLARALARPGSRHTISRASRVMVGVHPMADDAAHVRFDVDLNETRREAVRDGLAFGGFIGVGVGGIAVLVTNAVPGAVGDLSQLIAFGAAFGTGMAASVAVSVSAAASRFRNRVFAAKMEVTSLLDRLEQGGRLDPPPAPWRRKLQLRLFGDRQQ